MIHIQIIGKDDVKIYKQFTQAVREKKIRSFSTTKVKVGLKVEHTTYPGYLVLQPRDTILLVDLHCKEEKMQWRILQAFIGRIVDHFKDDISSINMQLV